MTREEAKKKLEETKKIYETLLRNRKELPKAKEMFDIVIKALEQPEVIKCGECKFFDTPECAMSGSCDGCELEYDNGFDETGFCSYGKRKDEG